MEITLKLRGKIALWQPNTLTVNNLTEKVIICLDGQNLGLDYYVQVDNKDYKVVGTKTEVDNLGVGEHKICVKAFKGGELKDTIFAPVLTINKITDVEYQAIDQIGKLETKVNSLAEMVEKMLMGLSVLFNKGGKK